MGDFRYSLYVTFGYSGIERQENSVLVVRAAQLWMLSRKMRKGETTEIMFQTIKFVYGSLQGPAKRQASGLVHFDPSVA